MNARPSAETGAHPRRGHSPTGAPAAVVASAYATMPA